MPIKIKTTCIDPNL